MIATKGSLMFRAAMLLGRFIPRLRIEQVRVGYDTTTFFRIDFKA